jgi:excisionase family DNA binding protein
VTVQQAALRLEISPATVYAMIAAGKLACVRHGLKRGCIRISDQQLADYLRSVEKAVAAPAPVRAAFRHVRLPGS